MNFFSQLDNLAARLPLPRKFTLLFLGFLIGTTISSARIMVFSNNLFLFLVLFFSIALVGFINLRLKNHFFALGALVFISMLMGFFWTKHLQNKNDFNWRYGQKTVLTGRIINRPVLKETKQEIILEVWTLGGEKTVVRPKILVYLPRYPYLNYADRLTIAGTIEQPVNFGDFNFENYLKKYPITAYIKQADSSVANVTAKTFGEQILFRLYLFCSSVERLLAQILPEPHSSFAAGLVLGQKTNLPEDLQNNLQITGTTHLIALSGYNVTIIIKILMTLLAPYLGRKKLLLVGISLVLFFIVMTGLSPSVVRAAIFSILIIFGQTIGRRGDQTNLLLLAASVMVFFNPNLIIYDVSFQLSFAAFIGLLYFSPILEHYFDKMKRVKIQNYLKKTSAETLGAQAAVLPVILYTFKTVSLISPLANLAVLWLIPPAMIIIFSVVFLGLIWLPLGKIGAIVIWPVLSYIIKAIALLAKIPGASLQLNSSPIILLTLPLLILLIFYFLKTKRYEKAPW